MVTQIAVASKPFIIGTKFYTFLGTRDKIQQLIISIQHTYVKYMFINITFNTWTDKIMINWPQDPIEFVKSFVTISKKSSIHISPYVMVITGSVRSKGF